MHLQGDADRLSIDGRTVWSSVAAAAGGTLALLALAEVLRRLALLARSAPLAHPARSQILAEVQRQPGVSIA